MRLNPDQSKHLSTAVMHLFGTEVNFNSLRKEKYEAHTRIPTIVKFYLKPNCSRISHVVQ